MGRVSRRCPYEASEGLLCPFGGTLLSLNPYQDLLPQKPFFALSWRNAACFSVPIVEAECSVSSKGGDVLWADRIGKMKDYC